MNTLLRGVAVAGIVALAIAVPGLLGLTSPWPVLLVAAVAFARPARPGAAGALLLGAASWWLAMALRAGVLPDTAWAEMVAAAIAITIPVLAAMVSANRMPLFAFWVTLGIPISFLGAVALSLVVATGLGFLAASIADLVGSPTPRDEFASLRTEAVS